MFSDQQHDHAERLAMALGEAVEAVALELRLIEVADFIAYIHCEQFANIRDVVNSSVEPYFKPGALSFGGAAEFELDWDRAPAIALDMEFRHRGVWVVFKLTLRALQTTVAIEYASVGATSGASEQDMARLIEALADAQLRIAA